MKKLFYIALLTLPLVGSAQSYNEPFRKRGEVFKVYAGSENKNPHKPKACGVILKEWS